MHKPELVCPAGALPALKTAVDNGADCVYIGLRDDTNARNFAGLNFDPAQAGEGVRYAHARGAKVLLARRVEDPDTLFFARRLIMEGDTELGLVVKNALDAVEWSPASLLAALAHPFSVPRA